MKKYSLTESVFGVASGHPREYIELMISSINLFPLHWINYSQGAIDVASQNGDLLLDLSNNIATEYKEDGTVTATSLINGSIHLTESSQSDPREFSKINISIDWKSEILGETVKTKDLTGSFSIIGEGNVALDSLSAKTPSSLFTDIIDYHLSGINISFKDTYGNTYIVEASGNFSSQGGADHLDSLIVTKNDVSQLTLNSLTAPGEASARWELKSTGDLLLPDTITGFTGDVNDQIKHLTTNSLNQNSKCVYRLWNTNTNYRLYTSNLTEIDTLTGLSIGWTNEGAMYKINDRADSHVHRFYVDGTHFYTASEYEKDSIQNNPLLSHYIYEGIAFNVFLDPREATNSLPVMRFFNLDTSSHLYSSAQSEINTLSERWINEGIAWYGDSF